MHDDREQLAQAYALYQAGKHAEAQQRIAPVARRLSANVDAQMLAGMIARANGDKKRAVGYFSAAAALAPRNAAILNVQANALAAAGEPGTAQAIFAQALSIEPSMLDAHISRAVVALDSRQYADAIGFADAGIALLGAHGRLLAIKAAALKEADRLDEALGVFDAAVAADPKRALTRHNHAAALRAAGRFDAASREYRHAYDLGMRTPALAVNWAASELEAGRIEQARNLYGQALQAQPDNLEALAAMTTIIWEHEGRDDAFDHYRLAAERTAQPAVWRAWVGRLAAFGQQERIKQVVARCPVADEPEIMLAAAVAHSETGAGEAAIPLFQAAIKALPDVASPQVAFSRHLLRIGDAAGAARAAEIATRLNPLDQSAWSYLGTAWRMAGDPREHWLHDYERQVVAMPIADTEAQARDLAMSLSAAVGRHHNSVRQPGDQSLRNGSQTSGNIFARNDAELNAFRDRLIERVGRYVHGLPDDPAHPFYGRKGEAIGKGIGISGAWSVRLRSQGFHVSHFHPQGWISSACYLQLPGAVNDPTQPQAGWIQFGQPPAEIGTTLSPRRVVRPEPGMLVLFPSSMWHGTIPFADQTDRITIAFDVVPRG